MSYCISPRSSLHPISAPNLSLVAPDVELDSTKGNVVALKTIVYLLHQKLPDAEFRSHSQRHRYGGKVVYLAVYKGVLFDDIFYVRMYVSN